MSLAHPNRINYLEDHPMDRGVAARCLLLLSTVVPAFVDYPIQKHGWTNLTCWKNPDIPGTQVPKPRKVLKKSLVPGESSIYTSQWFIVWHWGRIEMFWKFSGNGDHPFMGRCLKWDLYPWTIGISWRLTPRLAAWSSLYDWCIHIYIDKQLSDQKIANIFS